MSSFIGLTLRNEIHREGQDPTEQQEYVVRVEEVACWRSIVASFARKYIGASAPLFLAHFDGQCAYIMALQGVLPETLLDLLVEREFEYARYTNEMQQTEGGDALGTLVTQAAEHVGKAYGEGRNPVFLSAFSVVLGALRVNPFSSLISDSPKPDA